MRYRTIVCDPPWPVKDSGDRTASFAGEWKGRLDGAMKVPYAAMTRWNDAKAMLNLRAMEYTHAHLPGMNSGSSK